MAPDVWPPMAVADRLDTLETVHLVTQVVGKVRLAHASPVNHWWSTALYVTARGLTTSPIPHPSGPSFQIDLDLRAHRLVITTTSGEERSMPLAPRPVADVYAEIMQHLDDLGVPTRIWPVPVEIAGAIPFTEDRVHTAYDPTHAHELWRALVQADRVLSVFRGRFRGKASPVHLFWGSLDLAASRFTGRIAPLHPGGAPNCGPHVMHEAYSHEVSSAGYWPAGGAEGLFYSYVYPEPPGFRQSHVGPDGAFFDEALGEFVLPYELVRTATDPDAVLLEFFQSTYEAAATCGHWDREALERADVREHDLSEHDVR